MKVYFFLILFFASKILFAQINLRLDSASLSNLLVYCNPDTYDSFPNGKFRQCRFDKSVVINGILCKDWLKLYENSRIRQFQPVTNIVIGEVKIPGGSTVFLDTAGVLKECWFSEDVKIYGIKVKGGLVKIPTQFYPNGQISCCILAENDIISNVPCEAGMLSPVCFYPNGKLKSCTLSENTTFGKEKYVKGTKIQFGLDGKISVIKD